MRINYPKNLEYHSCGILSLFCNLPPFSLLFGNNVSSFTLFYPPLPDLLLQSKVRSLFNASNALSIIKNKYLLLDELSHYSDLK